MDAIRTPDFCGCPILQYGPATNQCFSQAVLFMTVLEAYINGRCDLADPCRRLPDSVPEDSYDFVVVGGGTAGAVVAGRLAENPLSKILIIEAGGDEPTPSAVPSFITSYWSQEGVDWMYETEPQEKACLQNGGRCTWMRTKMLGGCSVTNGMQYVRGHAADFDNWAANGAEGWSWNDVFPYFLRSEDNRQIGSVVSARYHSRGGPLPLQQFRYTSPFVYDFIAASIELGLNSTNDLNGQNITGFAIAQALTDFFRRTPTTTRVIIEPTSKKVTGVEYIKDGQTKTVKVAKEAIITAGTLNSPQILMLSGIGPRETLNKFHITTLVDLPGVGQNLHNHVGVQLQFTLNKEPDVPILNWVTATDYLLERQGPMAATGISTMTGILNSKYAPVSGQHPDVQVFFGGYSATCGDGTVYEAEEAEEIEPRRTISISPIATQPRSRGYVSLRSADPLAKPVLQPNYFSDEHELNVLVDAVRIALSFTNTTIMREKYGMVVTPGFGDQCPGGENLTDEYIRCLIQQYTAPENHQVGTCKIGAADDPMAVVDKELKVYGVKGLRVVDASVMPIVTTSGTMPATIMIGERGAEFIKRDHSWLRIPPIGLLNKIGFGSQNGDKMPWRWWTV